ncbi:MAG: GTP 3',8-cyclase MoaA [Bacteriovoracaceae bacterium]
MNQERPISKLRISVTDACNFRCLYCMPESVTFQDKKEHLSYDQISKVIQHLKLLVPLSQIRITGGEPLLRPRLSELILKLRLQNIHDIGLTTNGFFLSRDLTELKEAGLTSVNLSLDSLEKNTFYNMASLKESGAFEKVLGALEDCLNAGIKVKTNTVVMKNKNVDQIIPLIEAGKKKGFYPRFLELMSLGEGRKYQDHFFSMQEMLTLIHAHFGRSKVIASPQDSTSVNLKTESGHYFGIIASESEPFCQHCSRMRLSADGKLYGCLMKNEGLSLKNSLDNIDDVAKILQEAILMKPYYRIYSSETPMYTLGG